MEILKNQWKSWFLMLVGCQKIMKKYFGREKIEKLHFNYPSKNMFPYRIPEFRMVQLLKKSVESYWKTRFSVIYYRKSLLPE